MRTIKIICFSVLMGSSFLSAYSDASNVESDELRYRYNITENTTDLFTIKKKFGKILNSGDISYSLNASKEVVEQLDRIGNELDTIHVPEKMVHPYNVFLESVKAYRKSATCIRNAAEIMLGYFDGTEKDINQLIELSGEYVETANMYLDLSISLHSRFFDKQKSAPGTEKDNKDQVPEETLPEFDSYVSERISI